MSQKYLDPSKVNIKESPAQNPPTDPSTIFENVSSIYIEKGPGACAILRKAINPLKSLGEQIGSLIPLPIPNIPIPFVSILSVQALDGCSGPKARVGHEFQLYSCDSEGNDKKKIMSVTESAACCERFVFSFNNAMTLEFKQGALDDENLADEEPIMCLEKPLLLPLSSLFCSPNATITNSNTDEIGTLGPVRSSCCKPPHQQIFRAGEDTHAFIITHHKSCIDMGKLSYGFLDTKLMHIHDVTGKHAATLVQPGENCLFAKKNVQLNFAGDVSAKDKSLLLSSIFLVYCQTKV